MDGLITKSHDMNILEVIYLILLVLLRIVTFCKVISILSQCRDKEQSEFQDTGSAGNILSIFECDVKELIIYIL